MGYSCNNINTQMKMPERLNNYIQNIVSDFESILSERKADLEKISEYVSGKLQKRDSAKLIFICTHNSRRSHMSQLWAQIATHHYNIQGIDCYSGGTEATAFNLRSVKALRKAGFEIKQTDTLSNPVYLVRYATDKDPIKTFSKKYEDPFNPQQEFAAVMVCSHADKSCPVVPGADARFFLPYDDPKIADNTPDEESEYDERCRQIAAEMFFMVSKINR